MTYWGIPEGKHPSDYDQDKDRKIMKIIMLIVTSFVLFATLILLGLYKLVF